MRFFQQFSMRSSLKAFVFLQLPLLIITMRYLPCHARGLSLSSEYRFGWLKSTTRSYLIIGAWKCFSCELWMQCHLYRFYKFFLFLNSWNLKFLLFLWKIEKFLSSFLTNWTLEQKYSKCLCTKAFFLYFEFHLLLKIKTVLLIPLPMMLEEVILILCSGLLQVEA